MHPYVEASPRPCAGTLIYYFPTAFKIFTKLRMQSRLNFVDLAQPRPCNLVALGGVNQ